MNAEMNKESSFSEMNEFSKGNVCEYEAEKKKKKNISGWIHRDSVSVYPKGSTDDIFGIKM